MLSFIKRVVKYGIKSFFREGEIVFANIFILTLTILLFSSIFLLKVLSQKAISSLKEKADISIYFKDEISTQEISRLEQEISKIPGAKLKLISKEEALKNFQERHKDNEILLKALEEIGENPFPASLTITLQDQESYEKVVSLLENQNLNGIEKIDYSQRRPLIEKIFNLANKIEKSIVVASLVSATISILITFNTIYLSILHFKEEITIQKLVGASDWFVRGPFLVHGIISGALAAIFSFFLLFVSCWGLDQKFSKFLGDFSLYQIFLSKASFLLFFDFLIGICLEALASLIAIRKYLKV